MYSVYKYTHGNVKIISNTGYELYIKEVLLVQTTMMYIFVLYFFKPYELNQLESRNISYRRKSFHSMHQLFSQFWLSLWSILNFIKSIKLQTKWHIRWNKENDDFVHTLTLLMSFLIFQLVTWEVTWKPIKLEHFGLIG
jgi:hypothetical protein